MTAEQKQAALLDLAVGINQGYVDDEECARRLAAIGATETELEAVIDQ